MCRLRAYYSVDGGGSVFLAAVFYGGGQSAVSLYYLLTGRHIFDFPKDVAQQLAMILQDKPVPIQRRRREIPDQLAFAIHRAMAVEPDDRFEGIVGFRKALLPFSE